MYNNQDVKKSRKNISSTADLVVCEKYLLENQSDDSVRRDILIYLLHEMPVNWRFLAKPHIIWFLENRLEERLPWSIWLMAFSEDDNDVRVAVDAIRNQIDGTIPKMRSAIIFLWYLDKNLVEQYLKTLEKLTPLDPFFLERKAQFIHEFKNPTRDIGAEVYLILKRRARLRWSHSTYLMAEKIFSWHFFSKIPKPIKKYILNIFSFFESGIFWGDYASASLSLALVGSLQYEDTTLMLYLERVLMGSRMKERRETAEYSAYSACLALYRKDHTSLRENIKRMLVDPVLYNAQISQVERFLLIELKRKNLFDLREEIIACRSEQMKAGGKDEFNENY